MASKRYLYTRAILLILMFIAMFGIISSADAQKVHALLVIMDDDLDIRQIVDVNRLRVKKMLQLLDVNPEIWQADARQIQPHHINEWVRDRHVDAEDTILVYYSGHGHIDQKARHYLDLDMQNASLSLLRTDLAEKLSEKHCRLKMLITDTCSNRVQTSPLIAQSAGIVVSRKRRYTQNLFLKHKGFLDITAASPGQYAWGNNQIGGYFTSALIESFTTDSDTNKDGFLSWEEVFLATHDGTQNRFGKTTFQPIDERKMDNIGQTTQTPKIYSLPGKLTRSAPAVLSVTSAPSRASVYIDNVRVGKTPLESYEVNVGTNGERQIKMRLELDGYENMDLYIKGGYNKETGESALKSGGRYTWGDVHLEKSVTTPTDRPKKNNIDYDIRRIVQVFAGDRPLSSIGGIRDFFIFFLMFGVWWLLFGVYLWAFIEDSNFAKYLSISPKIYVCIIFFLCIASNFVYHFTSSLETWVKFLISFGLSISIGFISFFIILLFSLSANTAGAFSTFIGMVAFPILIFFTLIIPDSAFLKFYQFLVQLHIFKI